MPTVCLERGIGAFGGRRPRPGTLPSWMRWALSRPVCLELIRRLCKLCKLATNCYALRRLAHKLPGSGGVRAPGRKTRGAAGGTGGRSRPELGAWEPSQELCRSTSSEEVRDFATATGPGHCDVALGRPPDMTPWTIFALHFDTSLACR